jgi:hypothetical protein
MRIDEVAGDQIVVGEAPVGHHQCVAPDLRAGAVPRPDTPHSLASAADHVGRPWTLVLQRSEELDGNHYEILTPAAEALAGKHPLAAMLVLRAMVDFSLRNNRSGRYRHAARHLLECSSLGSAIEDFGRFEPHYAYEARLRREHGRKSSFWNLASILGGLAIGRFASERGSLGWYWLGAEIATR